MDKRTIIISQILMTGMMALSMSAIMLLIAVGPTAAWLEIWPMQFITAWPIAFVMTNLAWPVSQAMTRAITRAAKRGA